MKQQTFYLAGLRPAYSKAANQLLAAMDLGVDGAYVRDGLQIDITYATDTPTLEQVRRTVDMLVEGYEEQGWERVYVWTEFDGQTIMCPEGVA